MPRWFLPSSSQSHSICLVSPSLTSSSQKSPQIKSMAGQSWCGRNHSRGNDLRKEMLTFSELDSVLLDLTVPRQGVVVLFS
jgi:hypothetical protein